MSDIYYVYIHFNKINGDPFYVGKGKLNRFRSINNRSYYWINYVNKYGFDSIKIEDNLNEDDAFELEIYWITQLKNWGFNLVNLTDGGKSPIWWSNKKRPDISNKFKGHKVSEEVRLKISNGNKGKRNSIETEFKKGMVPKNKGKSKYKLFVNNRPGEYRKCLYCLCDFVARIDKGTIYCSKTCYNKNKINKNYAD